MQCEVYFLVNQDSVYDLIRSGKYKYIDIGKKNAESFEALLVLILVLMGTMDCSRGGV